MNTPKVLAACVLMITSFAGSTAYSASNEGANARVLKVGIVDNYLPCSDSGTDQKKSGFAVDIWREVQEEMVDVSYESVPIKSFDKAILDAAEGKVDLVVSCHTITKDRLKLVDFSVPYTSNSVGMISVANPRSFSGRVASLFSQEHISKSLLLLIGITGTVAMLITLLEKNKSYIKKREKVSQMLKTWALLFIGEAHESMAERGLIYVPLILLSGCAQILLVTILVAELTTSSILATRREPLEDLSKTDLRKMIYEGTAVVEGTETQRRLLKKVKDGGLYSKKLISKISFPTELPEMVRGMQSGKYKHILASSSVLQYILANDLNPLSFEISMVSNYLTPEAFVFGKSLPQEDRKIINQAISEMNYNGRIMEILERYK